MNTCNIQSLIFYQNVTPYLHLALSSTLHFCASNKLCSNGRRNIQTSMIVTNHFIPKCELFHKPDILITLVGEFDVLLTKKWLFHVLAMIPII